MGLRLGGFASNEEVIGILRQYNPWWSNGRMPDLHPWKRAAFSEIYSWIKGEISPRALMIAGARQIGKTTLLLQAIDKLLDDGVPPGNILYATFDHPLLKLLGLDGLIKCWREYEPREEGPEYILLDEIHFTKDWQTWIKHQVDFDKSKRIAVTGSASPLIMEGQESGVGRWHTVRLATLSFFEYLQIKKIRIRNIPSVPSLVTCFDWDKATFSKISDAARDLGSHFQEYLLRGGFPQCALSMSVHLSQKLLREDIIDKVLKRDMTAMFGVRRILELEQLFLYLCLHDGGLLDMTQLCSNLEIKKETVQNYIGFLEAAHLIYKLQPVGYGKEVLRGRSKVYLADPAIASSVLLRGRSVLTDTVKLGATVETAFFRHLYARFYKRSIGFSYWRDRDYEVDMVAEMEGKLVPFEVKYRSTHTKSADLKGLRVFCERKELPRAYVITRELSDFGLDEMENKAKTKLLKIPAALACYWLGQSEQLENA